MNERTRNNDDKKEFSSDLKHFKSFFHSNVIDRPIDGRTEGAIEPLIEVLWRSQKETRKNEIHDEEEEPGIV